MQRAAVPIPDSRPIPSPHQIEASLPLQLSQHLAWEEESGRRRREERRSTATLFKQGHLEDEPPGTAVPDHDLSSFRSLPYNRTVQANPPRVVTTITSLTHLPGPASSLHPPQPGGNGDHTIGIPTSFKIYARTFHRHPRAYLGQRKQEPLFALTCTLRDITLHVGAQKASSAVATYVHPNVWNPKKRHAQVRLPINRAGSELELAGRGSSALLPPYQRVIIKYSPLLTASFTVSFTVDVLSPGGGFRPETFEWRRSHGPAIAAAAAMGSSRPGSSSDTNRIHRSGMKLVRLATDAGHGGGEVATGGGEVVAVLYFRFKLTTRGYFMFQGTGAQGILGESFRMVAVMTAVGMWDQRRRQG